MRYTRISASFIVLCNFILTTESKLSGRQDSFEEELLISPLDDGKLLAHFQFTTLVELDSAVEKKGKRKSQRFYVVALAISRLIEFFFFLTCTL
jgi:hypothetical protein